MQKIFGYTYVEVSKMAMPPQAIEIFNKRETSGITP